MSIDASYILLRIIFLDMLRTELYKFKLTKECDNVKDVINDFFLKEIEKKRQERIEKTQKSE